MEMEEERERKIDGLAIHILEIESIGLSDRLDVGREGKEGVKN